MRQSESPDRQARIPRRGLAGVAHDMIVLAELQCTLLQADAADAARRMIVPGSLLVAGLLLAFACFPILLASLGLALSAFLPLGAAFLVAGVAGLLTAAVFLVVAGWLLRKNLASFRRSREEFLENVRWIKSVLKRSGEP